MASDDTLNTDNLNTSTPSIAASSAARPLPAQGDDVGGVSDPLPPMAGDAFSNGASPARAGQDEHLTCGTSPHFWNKENRAPKTRLCKQHTALARAAEKKAAKLDGRAEQPIPDVYDQCWAFSRFPKTTLPVKAFIARTLNGLAWIPSVFVGYGRRTNENWQSAELIAIDYDRNVSVADCLKVPFIRQHALLVHPSASSGKLDANSTPIYKTRVIFRLDVPITGNLENYRLSTIALCRLLGLPDDACSYKPAQLFYGSTNRIETPHVNLNARLPMATITPVLEQLQREAAAKIEREQRAREALNYQPVERTSKRAQNRIDQVLDRAAQKLARETDDRTTAAYSAGKHLGHYIPNWDLSDERVEDALISASKANGSHGKYGETEMLRHIRNGIAAGKLNPEPRELPARPVAPLRVVQKAIDRSPVPGDYEKKVASADPEPSPAAELETPPIPEPPADPYLFPNGDVPVQFMMELNHHTSREEAFLYDLEQHGLALGIIPNSQTITFEQVRATASALGFTIDERRLIAYFEGENQNCIHKRDNNIVCSFGNALRPIAEIAQELQRRIAVELRVKHFRAVEGRGLDIETGEKYILPIVPADLPPVALIDAGIDEVTAQAAAEAFKQDTFDSLTQWRRTKAGQKLRADYDRHCERLKDRQVVPLSPEVKISVVGDYSRALARSWHAAKVPNFDTQAAQMYALGVGSVHTLNSILDDAGVSHVEQFVTRTISAAEAVGAQIKQHCRELHGKPVVMILTIGAHSARMPYDRGELEAALARGEGVEIDYQIVNLHTVVELPATEKAPKVAPPEIDAGALDAALLVEMEDAPITPLVRPKRRPGHYPAQWVVGQLAYRYKLKTGQEAPETWSASELVERLISPPKDGLIDFACGQWEGVLITKLA